MPLWLQKPRPRKPFYVVRGRYLGVTVSRSTQTADRKVASRLMQNWRREIERGAYAEQAGPTWSGAVISYVNADGDKRFLDRLVDHFRDMPLAQITQDRIDAAAVALYPDATAATRNRQVYTPVSAVLRHAGIKLELRRPKGAQGKPRTFWLAPEQAFALLAAAEAREPRFGALCTYLLYTGCRLSEALRLEWRDVELDRATAYVRQTKNGEPRTCFLPEAVVAALANLNAASALDGPRSPSTFVLGTSQAVEAGRSVFRYTKSGELYDLFNEVVRLANIAIPDRVAFHCFRHTYGAWMRRYAGSDTAGLVGTGAWKSRQAAAVYEHVEVSEEAKKAAMLPVRGRG